MENSKLNVPLLLEYFSDHLNRICCAKTHMVQRFPEAAALATFKDLKNAIDETTRDVVKQIQRMNTVFQLLDIKQNPANCGGMTGMLDEAFESIHAQTHEQVLRDLSILFYMQNIESIEMTSFRILHMVATQLNNPEITQLLRENYDEAKEDRALLLLINKQYLAKQS